MRMDAARWWHESIPTEERWNALLSWERGIEAALEPDLLLRTRRYAYLYDRNSRLMGMYGRSEAPEGGDPLTENIIRSNIETATALLGNEALRVAALTDGAEWSVQRRAKQLERFLEAMFTQIGWDELQQKFVRSAGVAGNGYTKFEIEDGKIVANHIPFDEIIVDEIACRAGPPRSLAHRRFVNKDVLIAHYPDFEEEINRAHVQDPQWTTRRRLEGSQIGLVEGFHLPSRKGAGDGRRVLAIQGATLADEPYTRPYFPLVTFRWVDRLAGFYGCGLAEELAAYQLLVNKTNRSIRGNMALHANLRMLAHRSDAQLGNQMDDEEGGIYYYNQREPSVPEWPALKADVYKFRESIKTDAQRYSGIPDMAARSMKPVGLDSGAALREWTDIQASRLTTQKVAVERALIQAARQIIDLAKELYGKKQNVQAFWNSRNLARRIDWSEVDMAEDAYVLRIEPASAMSRTPAGMRQLVVDLAQTGALEPEMTLRLLGIPDVRRVLDDMTSDIEDIEGEIEDLYDGKWRAPDPFIATPKNIARMASAYRFARRNNAPDKVLASILDWITLAQNMQAPPQPTAAPSMGVVPFQAGVAAPAGPAAAAGPAPAPAAPMPTAA